MAGWTVTLGISLARAGAVARGDMTSGRRWALELNHGIEDGSVGRNAWNARVWALYAKANDGDSLDEAAEYADRAIAREPSPFAAGGAK